MTRTISEIEQRSTRKFKHIQAGNIWAFVRGKGELNCEEHYHLKRCKHCDAIFKYFAIYAGEAYLEIVEDPLQSA